MRDMLEDCRLVARWSQTCRHVGLCSSEASVQRKLADDLQFPSVSANLVKPILKQASELVTMHLWDFSPLYALPVGVGFRVESAESDTENVRSVFRKWAEVPMV